MKRRITLLTALFSLFAIISEAQYWGGGGYYQRGYRRPPPPPQYRRPAPRQRLPQFKPTVNLSIGYGFPNLDKDQLAQFYDAYKGTVTQQGPVTAALDYQFSRYSSIGVAGTYGKVSVPYFDYNSTSNIPSFTGRIENWSIMFNMVSYMPSSSKYVSPYLRTAIGVNNWKQNYLYNNGDKAAVLDDPSTLAYQVSIGTRFNLSQNAGFYLEAGYGKYILNGGLTFRF